MALNRVQTALPDAGLLLIRVMLGVVFVFHGSQKMFGLFDGPGLAGFARYLNESLQMPLPQVFAVMAASAELFGGLALLLGAYLRIAVVPMMATMLVAIFVVHRQAFSMQHQGMEYALTLAVVLLALGLIGPGRFALDALRTPRGSAQKDERPARTEAPEDIEPTGTYVDAPHSVLKNSADS